MSWINFNSFNDKKCAPFYNETFLPTKFGEAVVSLRLNVGTGLVRTFKIAGKTRRAAAARLSHDVAAAAGLTVGVPGQSLDGDGRIASIGRYPSCSRRWRSCVINFIGLIRGI